MPDSLYIRPIAHATSPQSVARDGAFEAVRLGGSLVWASRFALIRSRGKGPERQIIARELVDVPGMAAALARLPDDLAQDGAAQWAALQRAHPPLLCGARRIPLDQPQIMGILNVTPDSFSDGGRYAGSNAAVAHAQAMLAAGAAIIDIGGESTRPGAAAVWEGDEIARVVPMVEALSASGAAISVDTRRAGVMAAALKAGAHIFNDVSALRHDPGALEFSARAGVPVVLMHAPGEGEDLHQGAAYGDVVLDVFDWLRARRDAALAAGVLSANIILDPGIGFGKSVGENLALMNALELFHALGCPLLVGASRKRLIGALSKEAPADQRLGGSLMLAGRAMAAGVQLIRVHDVAESVQARDVWRGLRDAALEDFSEGQG